MKGVKPCGATGIHVNVRLQRRCIRCMYVCVGCGGGLTRRGVACWCRWVNLRGRIAVPCRRTVTERFRHEVPATPDDRCMHRCVVGCRPVVPVAAMIRLRLYGSVLVVCVFLMVLGSQQVGRAL